MKDQTSADEAENMNNDGLHEQAKGKRLMIQIPTAAGFKVDVAWKVYMYQSGRVEEGLRKVRRTKSNSASCLSYSPAKQLIVVFNTSNNSTARRHQ